MTGDTVGGVWHYALQLAEGLGAHDISVTLATMGRPATSDQRRAAAAIPSLTLVESTYKLEWMPDCWTDVERAGEWLLALADTYAPDVVHVNGFAHGALPWPAPHIVVGHSCVWSWWVAVHGTEPPPEWSRYRDVVRRGLHAARAVVAPSRAMLQALRTHYGIRRGIVVPNGRDHRGFSSAPKMPVVFTAGRIWDAAKNVAALAAVCDDVPWPIYVAGETCAPGGEGTDLSGIRCLGNLAVDELRQWLARAAIYALPARYEPFGLSVLEAGLSRCALVIGDIPSLRENWDGAAMFVPPGEAIPLRTALRDLARQPSRRADLQRRAFDRALEFSVDRMVGGYLHVYGSVAGNAEGNRQESAACAS
jgi:glycosyltransferase involved in cell wall biosynthesis